MPLLDLTPAERLTIKQCLDAVASGEIIADDWEFPTLFGIEFWELQELADAWPHVDENDAKTRLAINGALVNLLGYPHGKDALWPKYIKAPASEVARILSTWRGEPIADEHDGTSFHEDSIKGSLKQIRESDGD
jgi:hypothetical protein